MIVLVEHTLQPLYNTVIVRSVRKCTKELWSVFSVISAPAIFLLNTSRKYREQI